MQEAAETGHGPETTKPPERPEIAALREKVKLFFPEPDKTNYQPPYKIEVKTDTSQPGKTRTTKEAWSNGLPLASHMVEEDSDGNKTMESHTLNGKVEGVDSHVMVLEMAGEPPQVMAVLPDASLNPVSVGLMSPFTEEHLRTIRNTFGIEIGPPTP